MFAQIQALNLGKHILKNKESGKHIFKNNEFGQIFFFFLGLGHGLGHSLGPNCGMAGRARRCPTGWVWG